MTENTTDGGALALAEKDEVSQALAAITSKNANLTTLATRGRELHQQFKDVAFDVSTTKGMEAAKAARHQIRTEARYPMQELKTEGSKMLGAMQRQFNARAEQLISEVEGYEEPIDAQIKAEEQRKADIKAQAEAEEKARVDAISAAIDAVRNTPLALVNATAEETAAAITELRAEADDAKEEEFAEFAPLAKRTYVAALEQMESMLAAKTEAEAQAAELARQQAAQAEQQRIMDEQAAALRKQQEALAAQQRELDEAQRRAAAAKAEREQSIRNRIEAMRSLPARLAGAASANIESNLRTLNDTLILPGDFEQFVDEALGARNTALEGLRTLWEETIAAEQKAAEDLAAAQAAAAAKAEADRIAREAERVAQEQARAEQARAQAAEQAAREAEARVQALAKTMLGLLCQGVQLMPETEATAEWLAQARAVVAAANGQAQGDAAIGADVLEVVGLVFDVPAGDHLRTLHLVEDLQANAEQVGILIEEIGHKLGRDIPLVLAAQIAAAKTVQDVIHLMGGE